MEASQVTKIGKWYTFAAAHQLIDRSLSADENQALFGKCFSLHGHNYKFRVELMSGWLEHGMVLNYYQLDDVVEKTLLSRWDHKFLNDLPEFKDTLTTAENIVYQAGTFLVPILNRYGPSGHKVKVSELEICEGDKSYAVLSY